MTSIAQLLFVWAEKFLSSWTELLTMTGIHKPYKQMDSKDDKKLLNTEFDRNKNTLTNYKQINAD